MPAPSDLVQELLSTYDEHFGTIDLFRKQLLAALESSGSLDALIHSTKSRMKDCEHLREKLLRRTADCEAAGQALDIDPHNLLVRVNDLAGIRLLHLYTRQIRRIDAALKDVLSEQRYQLVEGPFARTWDDEYRDYFEGCGIGTQVSPTMYTSVHYIVGSASRTVVTCEIQVRTLMEEVWGEVDHTINYPNPTSVLTSSEQIKVLARVTSSATRLVDSIFTTHDAATAFRPPSPGAAP